jgi:hypothetical protein
MILACLSLQMKMTIPITAARRSTESNVFTTERISTEDFWQMVLSADGEVPSGQTLQVAPFPT